MKGKRDERGATAHRHTIDQALQGVHETHFGMGFVILGVLQQNHPSVMGTLGLDMDLAGPQDFWGVMS